MKITEDTKFRAEILERIAQREFSERKGVHQSDLVYCLNKSALRHLKPLPTTDSEVLIYSLGWATQRWLTGQDEDVPEIAVDGITVTPDALIVGQLWELKATFQSNTKLIEENIHWTRQLMAQCYVTESLVAWLSRLEIMGNWKWVYHPTKPETIQKLIAEFGENWAEHPTLHAYRFEFTQEELDRNWEWLKRRRDQYLKILETKELLPRIVAIASGQGWECGYCGYNGTLCKE